jgi:hypothetical protein
LVAGEAALIVAGVLSVAAGQAGIEQQHGGPVVDGELDRSVGVVGHAEHRQAVLCIQDDSQPFGEGLLVVGHHHANDRSSHSFLQRAAVSIGPGIADRGAGF